MALKKADGPMALNLKSNIFHAVVVSACVCLSALSTFAASHVLIKPDVSRAQVVGPEMNQTGPQLT